MKKFPKNEVVEKCDDNSCDYRKNNDSKMTACGNFSDDFVSKKLCSDKKFHCNKCDYVCSKLSLWTKHINTKKHMKKINEESAAYTCDLCNKTYSNYSSLWSHKKKCKNINVHIYDKGGHNWGSSRYKNGVGYDLNIYKDAMKRTIVFFKNNLK